MHKKMGAILLIAGTCIGSGMIALPLVLAKLGLVPSILLMLLIWFVMYYTSLINLELNLQAGRGLARGLTLGELGRLFSGKSAEYIGVASLKLLSYSLLAVFIYGGSSIMQKAIPYSQEKIATCCALITIVLLTLPIKLVDYFNRLLFIALLAVVTVLIAGLALSINWSDLPLFSPHSRDLSAWIALVPVVFTSFGFQVIFHTLTNYCDKNAKLLKQAFFWGSVIPAIVYILWTSAILSVVSHENPQFYLQMAEGKAEVGELIQVLSQVATGTSVQLMIWWISLLAIATSVIGVGVGLFDSLKEMMPIANERMRHTLSSVMTVGPAYLAVIYVPNAFINVLGFAGMILAIIAVILPTYLFWKIGAPKLHFNELKANWLIGSSALLALAVMACEVYNML